MPERLSDDLLQKLRDSFMVRSDSTSHGVILAIDELLAIRAQLAAGTVMPPLFETGWFRLHSGEATTWRVNCEALSDDSIKTLAAVIADRCKFGSVEGVPTGGLRLAEALRPLATTGPLLIVDDVLTTGASMEEHRSGRDAIGYVIFDRSGGAMKPWVRALWSADPVMPETPSDAVISAAVNDVVEECIDAYWVRRIYRAIRAALPK